ncbi:MAG: hypothetical protein ACE5Q3_16945 [Alphaproteobacteria bacterium]
MKLTNAQVQKLQEETGAQVVPRDDTLEKQLLEEFGDHTFFLDGDGLHVWELIEDEQVSAQKMIAVQLAAWKDGQRTALIPHEPKPFKVLLVSEPDAPDPTG